MDRLRETPNGQISRCRLSRLPLNCPEVPRPTSRTGSSPKAAPRAGRPNLSAREAQVLSLVAQGYTNVQIADALQLSRHTVARHIVNSRSKLGATNRAQAAALFLHPDPGLRRKSDPPNQRINRPRDPADRER